MHDQRVKLDAARAKRVICFAKCAVVFTLLTTSAMSGAVAVRYVYDPLGRLVQAVFDNGTTTTTISYSYDATGNRTAVSTTSP